MILKYNIEVNKEDICSRLKQLINLTYKILPMREENLEWVTLLSTVMEEFSGFMRLMPEEYNADLLVLLSKLEGLFTLTKEEDFFDFRRTIFECLSLMNKVREYVSTK